MRDRFMFGLLALAATMVGLLLLTSCSAQPSSPPASKASTESTRPYGNLTLAVDFAEGTILDVTGKAAQWSNTFRSLGAAVFDTLVDLDPELRFVPGIAERWEISPDGLVHTFYIRKGVKFHDGSDLTGADVKFSIDNMVAYSANSALPVWKPALERVELKDEYTVVFRMKSPQFELLKGLDVLEGQGAVFPKKYIEEKGWDYFSRNIVGSGPWKVVKLEPKTRLDLEAVDSHWRAAPKFKNITLLYLREEGTKVAMLKTGELDIADVMPDSAPGLKAAGLRMFTHYGGTQMGIAPFYDMANPEKYALSDVRVRKALSLAIDRKELADKIYGGYAQPSAFYQVPKNAYFFDSSVLKPDPYDPEQAKKLLAEAGYPNGFATKIWDVGGANSVTNLALAGYWRRLGIIAEIEAVEYASMIAKYIYAKQSPDIWGTVFPYTSPGSAVQFERMLTVFHSTKGSMKNLKNPRLDELIDKVQTMPMSDEKKRLALEAAVLAKNEYSGRIAGLDIDTLFALGPKVGGMTPIKGLIALGRAYETISHPN